MTLRSYRDLNAAKWTVIGEIESEYLVFEPFNREWDILTTGDEPKAWRERYAEQGIVERYLPWVFAALNVAVLITTLL